MREQHVEYHADQLDIEPVIQYDPDNWLLPTDAVMTEYDDDTYEVPTN